MNMQFNSNRMSITTIIVTYRYSEVISNHNITVCPIHKSPTDNLRWPHTTFTALTETTRFRLTLPCGCLCNPISQNGKLHDLGTHLCVSPCTSHGLKTSTSTHKSKNKQNVLTFARYCNSRN